MNNSAKFNITRKINAPRDMVFDAFSSASAMGAWWGPTGMEITVYAFDFKPGGKFHFKMTSGDHVMWALFKYTNIQKPSLIEFSNSFSDEAENICKAPFDMEFPLEINYRITLVEDEDFTTLTLEGWPKQANEAEQKGYSSLTESMNQGFAGTFNQLDQYLRSRHIVRKELKKDSLPRVCTYLNFPGTTEEAFNFYKKVFRSEFSGKGIQRFGDIPVKEGQPTITDEMKKMILHIELPITGGHILMATDSPREMGFTIAEGNNMHISVEPGTRSETDRIYNELSDGGIIEMPLQDMFFGSYFGSFKDKFGIHWMLNCYEGKSELLV